jgi:pseudaminic acid biosynthesis-associated methylase
VNYQTEQEKFWASDFGNEYPNRNEGEALIASNIALFSKILRPAPTVKSVAELGCNIGLNLSALNRMNRQFDLRGYEINELAAKAAADQKMAEIVNTTITEPLAKDKKFDLTFTKGVLIHINPDKLDAVYENLFALSNRYIMVCEYYNPAPVAIEYRGHKDRLFKRDFAGELISKYNLRLLDYGFNYHRDPYFTNDDTSWFFMEKST